ncbi:MAG: hypothetical protein IPH37_09660 [Burkholderiales bacterium]|nr:hypothetical protein [Burkholderiales bacterium]
MGYDQLVGGLGNDTYLFDRGSLQDCIFETGGTDTLRLGAGISPSQVTLTRTSDLAPNFRDFSTFALTADSLVISIAGSNDQIWLNNFFCR